MLKNRVNVDVSMNFHAVNYDCATSLIWQWNVPNSEQCSIYRSHLSMNEVRPLMRFCWGCRKRLDMTSFFWSNVTATLPCGYYYSIPVWVSRLIPQRLGVSQTWRRETTCSMMFDVCSLDRAMGLARTCNAHGRVGIKRVDCNQHYLFRVDSPLTYLPILWIRF